MRKCFAANYQPGPNWETGKPITEQPLSEHVAYLTDLHDKEVILMGGPYADGTAGLVILAASAIEEASQIINDDPAIRSGVLTAEVRQWNRLV